MNLAESTPFSMSTGEASEQLSQAFVGIRSTDELVVSKSVFIIRKALSSSKLWWTPCYLNAGPRRLWLRLHVCAVAAAIGH